MGGGGARGPVPLPVDSVFTQPGAPLYTVKFSFYAVNCEALCLLIKSANYGHRQMQRIVATD